jgi:hypothetical protein
MFHNPIQRTEEGAEFFKHVLKIIIPYLLVSSRDLLLCSFAVLLQNQK